MDLAPSAKAFLELRLTGKHSLGSIAMAIGVTTNDVFRFGYGNKLPNPIQKQKILIKYNIDMHGWGNNES